MKTKLLGIILLGLAALVNAQEKTLLETLVKKGTISEEEAAQIAKDRVVVTPSTKATKVLTIGGGIDAWFTWGNYEVKSPAGTSSPSANASGFELRYVKLGVDAEITGGWQAELMTDFGVEGKNRDYLDKVLISKKISYESLIGTLGVGMRKVNMGYEQNLGDFDLLTTERSVATWFFTRPDATNSAQKNFGSRAIGIFWDGSLEQLEGLTYGFAVVGGNSFEGSSAKLANYQGNNNLSFYANAAYQNKFYWYDNELSYKFGINFGYANGGMVRQSGTTYTNSEIWGINPFFTAKYKAVSFMAEYFLQNVSNGSFTGTDRATPQGFNAIIAYKIDAGRFGQIEPVVRVSMLSSNGMGFNPVTMGSFSYDPTNANAIYDNAQTYYIGANWYVIPAVKFSVGYEWGEYTGKVSDTQAANRTQSNTVRASLQVLF